MNNPPTDLLKRCIGDDRKAHLELYKWSFRHLMGICRRYYHNSEDVKSALNAVFLKIVQNLESFLERQDGVPFELWAKRISINYIIDEFRRNKRFRNQVEFMDVYQHEEFQPTIDPVVSKEKLEQIHAAVERLPEMSKTVFNLFVVDGYKHEEIGEMLNISSNTSKVHLHRAKQKLQTMLRHLNE